MSGGINLAPGENWSPRIVQAIRLLMQGRDNASGTLTLTPSAASTTVEAPNCAATSQVFTEPMTQHAAQERAAGTMWISSINNGNFVVTHANNAQTDRSFSWTARG